MIKWLFRVVTYIAEIICSTVCNKYLFEAQMIPRATAFSWRSYRLGCPLPHSRLERRDCRGSPGAGGPHNPFLPYAPLNQEHNSCSTPVNPIKTTESIRTITRVLFTSLTTNFHSLCVFTSIPFKQRKNPMSCKETKLLLFFLYIFPCPHPMSWLSRLNTWTVGSCAKPLGFLLQKRLTLFKLRPDSHFHSIQMSEGCMQKCMALAVIQ